MQNPTPSPSPSPTQTSVPLIPTAAPFPPTFVDGFENIPDGKYLFVELWTTTKAEETINGACSQFSVLDFPTYSYDVKTHKLNGQFDLNPVVQVEPIKPIRGFKGRGFSLEGKAGGGSSSGLGAIDKLPFIVDEALTINGVDQNGTIVIEKNGRVKTLIPNDSLIESNNVDEPHGCLTTTTTRFTNYGLLTPSQLDFN